ncbi:MAG: 6-hydroxymethylpterin diphosphokinase MptE-like protein [Alphaproteobacteria bacterium]
MAAALNAPAPDAPRVPAIGPDGTLNNIVLENPQAASVTPNVLASAARGLPMVRWGAHEGRDAVIVGTGPSLERRENWRAIKRAAERGAVVYALKGAATLLRGHGIPVHYVASCDPVTDEIDKMPIVPGATYLLASCCCPGLYDKILGAGCPVEVYHSFMGAAPGPWRSESDFYAHHFGGDGWIATGGTTVANRILDVALDRHGVRRVTMTGVDFGSRNREAHYARGSLGAHGRGVIIVQDGGALDGRTWFTQPTLMIAAIHVAKLILVGVVEVVGDSLAVAFARRPDQMNEAVRGVM